AVEPGGAGRAGATGGTVVCPGRHRRTAGWRLGGAAYAFPENPGRLLNRRPIGLRVARPGIVIALATNRAVGGAVAVRAGAWPGQGLDVPRRRRDAGYPRQ